MQQVSTKLKLLKRILKELDHSTYSDIQKKTLEALEKLKQTQNDLLSGPTRERAESELRALKKWRELAEAEETFLRQKSRIKWLKQGDQNSGFFHRCAAARGAWNCLSRIKLANGTSS